MSANRKSFVLHIDSLDILDDLEDEQVAKLFRAIKAFQNDEKVELDAITKMVFLPFKNQFTRDNEKYAETCKRRAEAGSKGGKAKVANASKSKQMVANQANLADSDSKNKNKSKSDSKSESKNKNINIICQQVADAYNSKLSELGKIIKLSDIRKAKIKASIKEMKGTDYNFESLDTWNNYFDYVSQSDFLMGRKSEWCASFDFLINKSNMIKVIEGKYENQ